MYTEDCEAPTATAIPRSYSCGHSNSDSDTNDDDKEDAAAEPNALPLRCGGFVVVPLCKRAVLVVRGTGKEGSIVNVLAHLSLLSATDAHQAAHAKVQLGEA